MRPKRAAGRRLCAHRSGRRLAAAIAGRLARHDASAAAPSRASTSVTHRYGKTAALDGVTLAMPAGCLVGLIGPDGVGKSSLLRHHRRRPADPIRHGHRARRRHGRCRAPRRGVPAHRLHAAGARQEPLSRPQRPREHRVLRPPVRAVPRPSGNRASPSCSTAPASRRLPTARRKSCRAACGRSSACAAR